MQYHTLLSHPSSVRPRLSTSTIKSNYSISDKDLESRGFFLRRTPNGLNLAELNNIFAKVGFPRRDPAKVLIALENSHSIVWVEDTRSSKPVAFARAIGDGVFNAVVWDVVVNPSFQGIGLGKVVVDISTNEQFLFCLSSNPQTSKMMMQMTFYWGKSVTLLFDSWTTSTWPAYLMTLLAVFLFSALYPYLEDRRLKFKALYASKPQISASSIESPLLPQLVQHSKITARCVDAMLFGVNSALGYMLMLAVMSYNGGVFLAVVLGLLFGYLVFRSQGMEVIEREANPCACA